ncbi:MAG: hypothetical protein MHM6MM_008975, partial [Cercozoa sp. M6MM]
VPKGEAGLLEFLEDIIGTARLNARIERAEFARDKSLNVLRELKTELAKRKDALDAKEEAKQAQIRCWQAEVKAAGASASFHFHDTWKAAQDAKQHALLAAEKKQQCDDLKVKQAEADKIFKQLKKESAQLKLLLEPEQRKHQEAENEHRRVEDEKVRKEVARDNAKKDAKKQRKLAADANKKIAKLKKQIEKNTEQIPELQQRAEASESEKQQQQQELDQKRQEVHARTEQLRLRIAEEEKQLVPLDQKLQHAQQQVTAAEQQAQLLQQKQQQHEHALREAEQAHSDAVAHDTRERDRAPLDLALDDANAEIPSDEACFISDEQLQQLRHLRDSQQQAIQESERERSRVQQQLSEAMQKERELRNRQMSGNSRQKIPQELLNAQR